MNLMASIDELKDKYVPLSVQQYCQEFSFLALHQFSCTSFKVTFMIQDFLATRYSTPTGLSLTDRYRHVEIFFRTLLTDACR
jgi:hypothetical protein